MAYDKSAQSDALTRAAGLTLCEYKVVKHMESCPFCGEELDALTRKISQLQSQIEKLSASIRTVRDSEGEYGETMYLGSTERQTFHRPKCYWASFLKTSPNLIEFSAHEEAVAAGYKPCKTCRA